MMSNSSKEIKVPSLYQVFENDFKIGVAVNRHTLDSQRSLIDYHFNSLTAENEMKVENLQPKEGQFHFEFADKLVEYAREHNKAVRGHTFVWHNQTPNWFFENNDGSPASRATLLERMKTHIETVAKRYKDDIYCWDVANEVISDSPSAFLRQSKWLEIIGESFIDKAFEYAHLAAPDAKLFYNDYNESDPIKSEKIYMLVKGLLERDVPIHGIGLQAHWSLYHPSYDEIKRAIEKYASLGLELQMTEMDVSVYRFDDKSKGLTVPPPELLEKLAERYEKFFAIFKEYSDVISNITLWAGADDYTWLDGFPVRGRKNWPTLFDEQHQPKEAFYRIIK